MPCPPPRRRPKNPQRDMPIGILGSLAICTVLYIAVALVLTGIVPTPNSMIRPRLPWRSIHWDRRWPGCGPSSRIGAIAGLSSVILVMLLGQPRIFYTMSKTDCCRRCQHGPSENPHTLGSPRFSPRGCHAGRSLFPIGLLGELVSHRHACSRLPSSVAGVVRLALHRSGNSRPFARRPSGWWRRWAWFFAAT